MLALLGAVFISGYYLIGGKTRLKMSLRSYVVLVYMTSAMVLLILCVAFNISIFSYSKREFLIFIGHGLYNWLLGSLSSTFITIATLGEPIFASIIAVIIFHEMPSITTALESLCVIAGLFLYIANEKNKECHSRIKEDLIDASNYPTKPFYSIIPDFYLL